MSMCGGGCTEGDKTGGLSSHPIYFRGSMQDSQPWVIPINNTDDMTNHSSDPTMDHGRADIRTPPQAVDHDGRSWIMVNYGKYVSICLGMCSHCLAIIADGAISEHLDMNRSRCPPPSPVCLFANKKEVSVEGGHSASWAKYRILSLS